MHRRKRHSCTSLCRRGWKKGDPNEPADHALGRSRGGFSTKIHLLVDGLGHLLAFVITGGQAHEATAFEAVLHAADENLRDGKGDPIAWPVNLAGDKGYRAAWIDEHLAELGIHPVIPCKSNEDRDARGIEFDRESYRNRNIVERSIGWLKECRRVFSRFEKTAINYCGMIKMAMIERFLKTTCQ
ncbi:IS5 family transposase [Stieleria maiorica]|uniref:IS5 family transposase n=1 Tax=Stieleria maiorica TaxID=2795974 RepID=UPI0021BCDABB|nr:IS5 family transposase [Stieleria maiorica]